MSVLVKIMIADKTSKVPCINRVTCLEFTDAPGLPDAVTDDADNTYKLHSQSDDPKVATWYTAAVHMPNHITLKYPDTTDGFNTPRDLPRKGSTK